MSDYKEALSLTYLPALSSAERTLAVGSTSTIYIFDTFFTIFFHFNVLLWALNIL